MSITVLLLLLVRILSNLCTNPITLPAPKSSRPYYFDRRVAFRLLTVPCGKCCECIERKQKMFAVKAYDVANEFKGQVVFSTYTYRPDRLPFSCSIVGVDSETGEEGVLDPCFILKSRVRKIRLRKGEPSVSQETNQLLVYLRSEYRKFDRWRLNGCRGVNESVFERDPRGAKFASCYQSSEFLDNYMCNHNKVKDNPALCDFRYVFTPSVDTREFQLFIKRSRIRYERVHGKPLPEFKYMFVGEYGHERTRPHFHCLWFGLTEAQVDEISQDWEDRYGSVYTIASGGTPADSVKLAKYVSKYISKGKLDNPAIGFQMAKKCRYCTSKNFGRLSQERIDFLRRFYFCFDIFGDYDIRSPFPKPSKLGRALTGEEKETLLDNIIKRSYITIPKFGKNGEFIDSDQYPLPITWKHSIYYRYEKAKPSFKGSPPLSARFVPFPIYLEATARLQSKNMDNRARQFEQFVASQKSSTDMAALCSSFEFKEENLRAFRESRAFIFASESYAKRIKDGQ